MAQSKYPLMEFSGALQQRTTTHIKKPNEVVDCANIDFSRILGAMVRRPGTQSTSVDLPALPDENPVLGAFVGRFPETGTTRILAANNVAADTSAVLRSWDGSSWTAVQTGMVADSEVNMTQDLEEVWVSTYDPDADTIGTSFTFGSDLTPSTTRHLRYAPNARFFMEFNGAMWAANVVVDGVRYRDRLYKSSGLTGAISYVRAPVTLTQTAAIPTAFTTALEIDSVRYLKPGMPVDIYTAGTETRLYQITIGTVDKAADTISFTPDTETFANTSINTTTDVITVPSNTWMTTGTPVTFWMGSGAPGGLTQGGVYYVINLTATTIKLATTRANALAGTAIDITSQGTGTHRVTFTLVLGNKDEIWGRDRKGKLTRYWNTDYRNPEEADWLKLPPTFDAVNDLTALGKLAGRMFWFTENAMIRYDGQNRIPLKNDVGCISHRTIGYYDSFMVWLDAKGQVWIRDEEGGQMDVISIPVETTLNKFTQDQLRGATSVCVGAKYKLTLGELNGSTIRLTYDFKGNQWSIERFGVQMPAQFEYKHDGIVKPHFFDQTGQLWVDETGDDDNGKVIPMEVELGDDNFGVDEIKSYVGIKVYSKNAVGTKIMISIDGGEFLKAGQIQKRVESIEFPKAALKGTMMNLKFTNSSSSDAPEIHKATIWYNREEDTFRATVR